MVVVEKETRQLVTDFQMRDKQREEECTHRIVISVISPMEAGIVPVS